MKDLNFKGLNCPQPVINLKRYLEANPGEKTLKIIVDNNAASENIKKFLSTQSFSSVTEKSNGDYIVEATREEEELVCEACENIIASNTDKSTLIMITHNVIGNGNIELGKKLMLNFIATLGEIEDKIWRIVLLNEGVKLVAENSETAKSLEKLYESGVSILVCGTCLEFFGLSESKKVGDITNMLDVITSLQVAEKVINI